MAEVCRSCGQIVTRARSATCRHTWGTVRVAADAAPRSRSPRIARKGWPRTLACLRCDGRFRAQHPGNRLCDPCRLAVAELGWWAGAHPAWRLPR